VESLPYDLTYAFPAITSALASLGGVVTFRFFERWRCGMSEGAKLR
jgi:hypothetical protein